MQHFTCSVCFPPLATKILHVLTFNSTGQHRVLENDLALLFTLMAKKVFSKFCGAVIEPRLLAMSYTFACRILEKLRSE